MTTLAKLATLAATLLLALATAPGARAAATFNTCLSTFYYQGMMRSSDAVSCYGAANATFLAVNIFNTTPYSVYFTLQGNGGTTATSPGATTFTASLPISPSPQTVLGTTVGSYGNANLWAPYSIFCTPTAYDGGGYQQFWGPCRQGQTANPSLQPTPSFAAPSVYAAQPQAYVLQYGMVLPPFSQIQLTYIPAAAMGGTVSGNPSTISMVQDAQLTMVMAGPGVKSPAQAASTAIGVYFGSSVLSTVPVQMSNTIFDVTGSGNGSGNSNSAVTTSQQVVLAGGYALFNSPVPPATGYKFIPSPNLGPWLAQSPYLNNTDLALVDNVAANTPGGAQFAMVLRGTVGSPSNGGGPPAFNIQIGMNNANVIAVKPNATIVQTSISDLWANYQSAVPATMTNLPY